MDLGEELEERSKLRFMGFWLIGFCFLISLCGVAQIQGNEQHGRIAWSSAFIDASQHASGRKRQASDIRLSKHQIVQTPKPPVQSNDTQLKKTVKTILTEVLTFTWDKGVVPYTIDDTYSPRSKKLIQASIDDFEDRVNKNTTKDGCISFKKIPTDSKKKPINYVNFFPGEKCDSTVGRPFHPDNHNVSIGPACMTHGVIQHELLHILGFWHEQSRTDRDKYINIVWENVIEDAKENFRQYSDPVDDHLGLPYDYGSIMHYQSNAFSVNGNDTIIPIYAKGNVIGQRAHPSALDLIKVRLRYQCMEHLNESIYRNLLQYPIPLYADDNAPDQH